jgi:RNA polymerase sigma-70 factor (ECF subfamily)
VDELTLVQQAVSGDDAAFEALVRHHSAAVWHMASSLLDDDFTAEEAVQDTFLKAYSALGGFRGEAAVGTWLLAICHRCCLDRLRRRRPPHLPLDAARASVTPNEDADDRLTLEAALPALSDDHRQAFMLVDVAGYSSDEAAAIAGVPASTMRSRVARARAQLLHALNLGLEAEEPA